VEQNGGRASGLEFEVDLDAVTLVGANPRTGLVETEPLLVVALSYQPEVLDTAPP